MVQVLELVKGTVGELLAMLATCISAQGLLLLAPLAKQPLTARILARNQKQRDGFFLPKRASYH